MESKVKHPLRGGKAFCFDSVREFIKIKEFVDVSIGAKGEARDFAYTMAWVGEI